MAWISGADRNADRRLLGSRQDAFALIALTLATLATLAREPREEAAARGDRAM